MNFKIRILFLFSQKCIKFASEIKKRDVAQLVARYVRDVEVAGSNLVIPTLRRVLLNKVYPSFFCQKMHDPAAENGNSDSQH